MDNVKYTTDDEQVKCRMIQYCTICGEPISPERLEKGLITCESICDWELISKQQKENDILRRQNDGFIKQLKKVGGELKELKKEYKALECASFHLAKDWIGTKLHEHAQENTINCLKEIIILLGEEINGESKNSDQ